MRLSDPYWLFLLLPLAWLAWRRPQWRLHSPLRAAVILCVLLLLAGLQIRRQSERLDVWVLLDRSDSANHIHAGLAGEWLSLLERARPPQDRLRIVDFAGETAERTTDGEPPAALDPGSTRTAQAIRHALSRRTQERLSRILVLTDGYATEPLTQLEPLLAEAETPLDFRLTPLNLAADTRIAHFRAPPRTNVGQPVLIEFQTAGPAPDRYVLSRNGTAIATGRGPAEAERGRMRFVDRPPGAGVHRYDLRLWREDDSQPRNNAAELWVEVSGERTVLVAGSGPDDPVPDLLRRGGMSCQLVSDPSRLDAGSASGASLIVLNNVSASELPAAFLQSLPFAVTEQGRGLLMLGGKNSFGGGGFFQSPIDPLLPVSMELRREHRKLAVAMALVLDRSGSMTAMTAAGRTKMDLANDGAARAVDLLGEFDQAAVIAADSLAHIVVPLTGVGPNRQTLRSRIRAIESMGGGIFVHTALQAAWAELQKSVSANRHIILFSDAADSEEPGDYPALISNMRAGNATLSVIGLGTPADADAALLEDIALRGGGRMFFCDEPSSLPALFAQETAAVARSLFVESETPTASASGWQEIAARPMSWPTSVGGFNLCYLRPNADAALISADAYTAPLVAFANRGTGRTGAVTFPFTGAAAARTLAWEHAADFLQTFARWLAAPEIPPGLFLRTIRQGTVFRVELLHDESWIAPLASKPPVLVTVSTTPGSQPRRIPWRSMAPGRFEAVIDAGSKTVWRGAVQTGEVVLPFGPISTGIDAEFEFDKRATRQLRDLSLASGGSELTDLSTVWDAPRAAAWGRPINLLLLAGMAAFLLDALADRLGWRWRTFWVGGTHTSAAGKGSGEKSAETRSLSPHSQSTSGRPPLSSSAPPSRTASSPPPDDTALKRRFERAKRRR